MSPGRCGRRVKAGGAGSVAEDGVLDGAHGSNETRAGRGGHAGEEVASLLLRALIEHAKDGATLWRKDQIGGAAVGLRGRALHESGFFMFGEDAAEIAGVHAQCFSDVFGAGFVTGGQFVENASFSEAIRGSQKTVGDGADESGIEAIELAERGGIGAKGWVGHEKSMGRFS